MDAVTAPTSAGADLLPPQVGAGDLAALHAKVDALAADVAAVLALAHELGRAVQQFAGMAEQLSGGGIGAVLGMLRK